MAACPASGTKGFAGPNFLPNLHPLARLETSMLCRYGAELTLSEIFHRIMFIKDNIFTMGAGKTLTVLALPGHNKKGGQNEDKEKQERHQESSENYGGSTSSKR